MDIRKFLKDSFPSLPFEEDFSFARHTTIGCGGTAAAAVSPSDGAELAALLSCLEKFGIPYCFLGAGANVLPSEGVFEGVVVRFGRMNALTREGRTISAGAGVTGGALLRFARQNGLGGLEFLSGIPMTVGGAAVMNAGVRGKHMSDVVCEVTAVRKGRTETFSAADCLFSEKRSVFQSGIAVAGVKFACRPSSEEEILSGSARYRALRRRLPKGRSMGCVFVNPEGRSAGEIIEACGFKGYSAGGARVSEAHANFILNEGAGSAEISALIEEIKTSVFERTGILLAEEIKRIP